MNQATTIDRKIIIFMHDVLLYFFSAHLFVTVLNTSTEFQSSDRAEGALYSVDGWGGLVSPCAYIREPGLHLFGAHYVHAEYYTQYIPS